MSIVTCDACGTRNRVRDAGPGLQATCGKCGKVLNSASGSATDDHPIHITDANFAQTLADAGPTPLLIDCWAPWCGPCRMVGPIIDQLARESGGRYRIGKLNVDENPQTAAHYQISSIPTMLLFKGGNMVDRLIGAQPKHVIAARLAQAL